MVRTQVSPPGSVVAPVMLIRPLILTMVLGAMYFGSRKIKKGGRLPILLICLSAMAGIAAYEL